MTIRHRLLTLLRSILIGWVSLLLLVFLVDHPLLKLTGPILGAQWIATAGLGLDCAALVASGWVVGRLSWPIPMLGVTAFAVTLTFVDLSSFVSINIPWLIRLIVHVLTGESAYLSSLVSTAASQALLFACLIGGGMLSRPSANPVSITGGQPDQT